MPESSANPIPTQGRLCGVDYGTVRIGLAMTDVEQRLATPGEIYHRRSPPQDAERFRSLAREERLVGFIVGLPVHGHGGESATSRAVRQFGAWLTEQTAVPVAYFDERYTSVEADNLLREAGLKASQRKKHLDKLAAQLLLTAYLETRGHASGDPGGLEG